MSSQNQRSEMVEAPPLNQSVNPNQDHLVTISPSIPVSFYTTLW